ncbi:MAG: hypothetical protein ACO36I_00610 [Candidatus Latescibacterota bacterium]
MNRFFWVCLILFLGVSNAFAEDAEPDSAQVAPPTFSMTPT